MGGLFQAYRAYVTSLRPGKKPMPFMEWKKLRAVAAQEYLKWRKAA